jgi:hypothetical protein
MKRLFFLSMLIPLAMVCSCQKQDVAAEQQLAQRKAELDAREKVLDEREKALAERERIAARISRLPTDLQSRGANKDSSGNSVPAPSIPPSIPAGLIPTQDATQLKAERERRIQERLAQRQKRLDALKEMRRARAQVAPNAQTSPGAEVPTNADASGGAAASSPSPSPTP